MRTPAAKSKITNNKTQKINVKRFAIEKLKTKCKNRFYDIITTQITIKHVQLDCLFVIKVLQYTDNDGKNRMKRNTSFSYFKTQEPWNLKKKIALLYRRIYSVQFYIPLVSKILRLILICFFA